MTWPWARAPSRRQPRGPRPPPDPAALCSACSRALESGSAKRTIFSENLPDLGASLFVLLLPWPAGHPSSSTPRAQHPHHRCFLGEAQSWAHRAAEGRLETGSCYTTQPAGDLSLWDQRAHKALCSHPTSCRAQLSAFTPSLRAPAATTLCCHRALARAWFTAPLPIHLTRLAPSFREAGSFVFCVLPPRALPSLISPPPSDCLGGPRREGSYAVQGEARATHMEIDGARPQEASGLQQATVTSQAAGSCALVAHWLPHRARRV